MIRGVLQDQLVDHPVRRIRFVGDHARTVDCCDARKTLGEIRGRGHHERAAHAIADRADPGAIEATLGGQPLALSPTEFHLLVRFMERPGRVLSRDQLLELVKGSSEEAFDRAIDVQVSRLRQKLGDEWGHRLIKTIRGVEDAHLHQVVNVPALHIDVDQTRARELGFTQQDVANSVLVSLSGSGQVQPAYWLNPQIGIQYLVNVRAPERAMDTLAALEGPWEPMEAMRAAFEERRGIIVDGLNAIPGIECLLPEGAFYAFADITGTGFKIRNTTAGYNSSGASYIFAAFADMPLQTPANAR